MTPEERQMLAGLFERINAAGSTPRDAQAEAFINDAVRSTPYAPYVLAQTVLIQQHALEAAAQRMADLEAQARQGAQPHEEQGSFLGNLGRSIFGGGQSAPPPPPPRQNYDPSYQREPPQAPGYGPPPQSGYATQRPGPWGGGGAPQPMPPQGGGGGGFLQNAASTAAGVAGGVVLGNMLGGLFGGHSGGGLFGGGGANAGLFGGGQPGGNETINIFENAPDRSGDQDIGQVDPSMPDDAGYLDDSSFDDGSGGGGFDDV
jgi:hypothetical protein